MDDRWAKLEEIVRRVVREELSTVFQQKPPKQKVRFEEDKFVGLGELELAALSAAFPSVDVPKELREAAAWILLNPATAPKSNYGGFINTWMKKHQDRTAMRSIPTTQNEIKPKVCSYCQAPATGSTNNYLHCSSRECFDKAMGGDKPVRAA